MLLDDRTHDQNQEKYRRCFYYSEYHELVRGTQIEYITLDISLLSNADVRRLISEYRGLFKYNLIDKYVNFAVRSVILSFKFLSSFYLKDTADFGIILYTLKTLAFEAEVDFSSIHEIRSLVPHRGELEEHLYLKNYLNKNPCFRHRFETLRRYPSEICLRIRTFDL